MGYLTALLCRFSQLFAQCANMRAMRTMRILPTLTSFFGAWEMLLRELGILVSLHSAALLSTSKLSIADSCKEHMAESHGSTNECIRSCSQSVKLCLGRGALRCYFASFLYMPACYLRFSL